MSVIVLATVLFAMASRAVSLRLRTTASRSALHCCVLWGVGCWICEVWRQQLPQPQPWCHSNGKTSRWRLRKSSDEMQRRSSITLNSVGFGCFCSRPVLDSLRLLDKLTLRIQNAERCDAQLLPTASYRSRSFKGTNHIVADRGLTNRGFPKLGVPVWGSPQ